MDPAPIEGATRTLAEDQDEYLALQIRDEDFHGQPCMTSAWRPTEAELAALNNGAAVALSILGNIHPPVMLHVAPTQEENKMPKTLHSPILKYFEYAHLPDHLKAVSEPFGVLASKMDVELPDGAEKSAGLRKLLEAKDCMVRAALPD